MPSEKMRRGVRSNATIAILNTNSIRFDLAKKQRVCWDLWRWIGTRTTTKDTPRVYGPIIKISYKQLKMAEKGNQNTRIKIVANILT